MLPRFLCTIKTRTLGPFLVLFYRLKQTVLPTRYQAVLPVATLARSSELTRRDADAKTERRAREMAQGAAATGGAGGKGGLPQTPLPPREHTCYISEFTNICLSLALTSAGMLRSRHSCCASQRPDAWDGCALCLENCHSP